MVPHMNKIRVAVTYLVGYHRSVALFLVLRLIDPAAWSGRPGSRTALVYGHAKTGASHLHYKSKPHL